MVEKNMQILALIDDGYSIQDIRKKLDIDYKELNTRLKQIKRAGFDFLETYMTKGNLIYAVNREIELPFEDNTSTTIHFEDTASNYRFLAIADTHFGHKEDSMEMINNLYNYAAANGIHNILIAGDFIEGDFTCSKYVRNKTVPTQLSYVLKNYPYSDEIMNYILLGNHDQHSLSYGNGLNVMKVLNQGRYDFKCLGYGQHVLKIRNVNIVLKHQLNGVNIVNPPYADLTLFGHSHVCNMELGERAFIHIPACSNVVPGNDIGNRDKYQFGALDIDLKLKNTTTRQIDIKQLDTSSKVKVLNSITHRLGQMKNNKRN